MTYLEPKPTLRGRRANLDIPNWNIKSLPHRVRSPQATVAVQAAPPADNKESRHLLERENAGFLSIMAGGGCTPKFEPISSEAEEPSRPNRPARSIDRPLSVPSAACSARGLAPAQPFPPRRAFARALKVGFGGTFERHHFCLSFCVFASLSFNTWL